jgi:hypothetical protein
MVFEDFLVQKVNFVYLGGAALMGHAAVYWQGGNLGNSSPTLTPDAFNKWSKIADKRNSNFPFRHNLGCCGLN